MIDNNLVEKKRRLERLRKVEQELQEFDWSSTDKLFHWLIQEKAELLFELEQYKECIDFIWKIIDEGQYDSSEDICWIISSYDKLIEQHPSDVNLYIMKAKATYFTRLCCSEPPFIIFKRIIEINESNIEIFPKIIEIFEGLMRDYNDSSDCILLESLIFLNYKLKNYKKVLEYYEQGDNDFDDELHMESVDMIFQAFIAERRYSEGVQFCDRLLETDDFADSEVVIEMREKLLSMGKNDK